jgi:adenylyltransferase/sulfurtransferase
MAVKVIIPTALRQYTGGQGVISLEGATVGDVLQSLTSQHSELGQQLFGSDGKLRSFVNVYRNDDDVRYLQGMETTVGERDELSIIPAIAGGQ